MLVVAVQAVVSMVNVIVVVEKGGQEAGEAREED
jgi:hypothetical protein